MPEKLWSGRMHVIFKKNDVFIGLQTWMHYCVETVRTCKQASDLLSWGPVWSAYMQSWKIHLHWVHEFVSTSKIHIYKSAFKILRIFFLLLFLHIENTKRKSIIHCAFCSSCSHSNINLTLVGKWLCSLMKY